MPKLTSRCWSRVGDVRVACTEIVDVVLVTYARGLITTWVRQVKYKDEVVSIRFFPIRATFITPDARVLQS